MKPPASEADLTFATPDDSGFPFVLFLCVLGSFLAHAGTFILFRVVYPERVTIPQPAPRVSLLTPSSPENVALLRWIEAEDPALVANDNTVPPPGLADVQYHPSFSSPRTAPVGAPAEPTSGVRFPQARDRLSVTETTSEAARPKTMAMPETEITFSSGLADRALKKAVPLTFEYRAAQAADSTRVLLGVDDQGTVRFTVLQRSSGDPNLDNLAMTHLRSMVFSPAAAPMSWGFATFSWGNEAYTAAPSTP